MDGSATRGTALIGLHARAGGFGRNSRMGRGVACVFAARDRNATRRKPRRRKRLQSAPGKFAHPTAGWPATAALTRSAGLRSSTSCA
jgi:hypothetical protein